MIQIKAVPLQQQFPPRLLTMRTTAGRFILLWQDDDYHCCPKQLRPSCPRMEPYICPEGFDAATYDMSVDNDSRQSEESLFQSLHHQVFPKHHFAEQRHEGQD